MSQAAGGPARQFNLSDDPHFDRHGEMPACSRMGPPAEHGQGETRPRRQPPSPARRRGLEWHAAQEDARALSSPLDPLLIWAGLLVIGDGITVALAAASAFLLRYGLVPPPPHVVLATSLAVLIMMNLTYRHAGTASAATPGQFTRVLRDWALTMVGLLVAAYITHTSDIYARLWATYWFMAGLAGFMLVRLGLAHRLRLWRRRGRLARMVAIVDLDGAGRILAQRLRETSPSELRLLGVFTPGASVNVACASATINDLIALSRLFRIDDILVAVAGAGSPAAGAVLRRLSAIPATVRLAPVLPAGLLPPGISPLGLLPQGLPVAPGQAELLLGCPTLVVCRRPLPGWHAVLKRAEDLVLASLMLAVLSPLMLALAVIVRIDSPGPALFRQKRWGFNNNPITVYKFRSMAHTPQPNEAHVVQASRNDPRVTKIGRLLRRSSLDELPQLLNVLRGEMSIVGPRPHAIAHNVHYAALIDDYLGRHRVQPGITGWAQVNGFRGETDTLEKMQKRVEFDLAYIARWSVLFDLRIVLQTALGVFFHRAAY